jgi:predicted Ser/Thr protein kinase
VGDYKSIVVTDGCPVKIVRNPTSYPLIGRGGNGAVFKLTDDKCVKIYPDENNARNEGKALALGQSSPIFPRLHKAGRKYVVMEYISGAYLDEYLQEKGSITDQVTKQILFFFK